MRYSCTGGVFVCENIRSKVSHVRSFLISFQSFYCSGKRFLEAALVIIPSELIVIFPNVRIIGHKL